MSMAIGFDLGGTNLKGAAVDRSGCILARHVRAFDGVAPDAAIAALVDLVDQLAKTAGGQRSDVMGVGVGTPGPLNLETGRIIRAANLPGWVNVPLRDALHEKLNLPVILENDGNAAAFGEFWMGSSERTDDLVMLTLGTGVGAGAVIDGKTFHGHFDNAAELGHTIVALDGLPCACGQRGCLEQYTSASGVAGRVVAAIGEGEASALTDAVAAGEPVDAKRVAQNASDGDPLCLRIWDEACRYLAIACINIQHAYNPARVLLGGGMSHAGPFLLDRVRDSLHSECWSLHNDIPDVQLAKLGYDAGLVGAAGLVWRC